jgi:hypothetical protein
MKPADSSERHAMMVYASCSSKMSRSLSSIPALDNALWVDALQAAARQGIDSQIIGK